MSLSPDIAGVLWRVEADGSLSLCVSCLEVEIIPNEKALLALGAPLVYNFLLVVTIPPNYVSGC